ncbi:hypothetical protein C8R43DRAFT_262493 [Mycena crocata]|nr:hypothetical protein C8R43DRAFT_262493 [Mycena crocata]
MCLSGNCSPPSLRNRSYPKDTGALTQYSLVRNIGISIKDGRRRLRRCSCTRGERPHSFHHGYRLGLSLQIESHLHVRSRRRRNSGYLPSPENVSAPLFSGHPHPSPHRSQPGHPDYPRMLPIRAAITFPAYRNRLFLRRPFPHCVSLVPVDNFVTHPAHHCLHRSRHLDAVYRARSSQSLRPVLPRGRGRGRGRPTSPCHVHASQPPRTRHFITGHGACAIIEPLLLPNLESLEMRSEDRPTSTLRALIARSEFPLTQLILAEQKLRPEQLFSLLRLLHLLETLVIYRCPCIVDSLFGMLTYDPESPSIDALT